ncbi:hypothetical protein BT96DRAFT_917267, partial [Gymnopus androsaceus JB14]
RITQLEKENAQMWLVHQQLKSHFGLKAAEINSYKSLIVSENLLISDLNRAIDESQKELHFLEISIDHLEKFLVPHSPWSTLIPAVIGDRSQDHYASALGVTLQDKIRSSPNQKLCPGCDHSVCVYSFEVQDVLSVQRQEAVDALWSKLKSGELPIRSTVVTQARELLPSLPRIVDASSLFMPSDPKPELSASAAASIMTVNASLIRGSSSGGSLPSTQSSGNSSVTGSTRACADSETSEPISPLPRLSLFSSDFWAAADSGGQTSVQSGSESGSSDFTTEDALQSLELIYSRFNNIKLDTIEEANPVYPATVVLSSVDIFPHANKTAAESESSHHQIQTKSNSSDLDADFVFVTIPAFSETPSPKKRTSILQSLNLSTRIPRRLSISLSPPSRPKVSSMKADTDTDITKAKATKPKPKRKFSSPTRSRGDSLTTGRTTPVQSPPRRKAEARVTASPSPPSHSLFRPTISSSLKKAGSPPRTTPNSTNSVVLTPSPQNRNNNNNNAGNGPGSARSVHSVNRGVTPTFGRGVVSPSPTKKSAGASRRTPVLPKRPPPPIPSDRGKENLGMVKKSVGSSKEVDSTSK